jgi:hypothetical protein
MGRASVAAAGFAVAGGMAAETTGVVVVTPVPDRYGRVLLACVEPLELSARGMELAGVALRALREAFDATPGPGADALLTAFAAANSAVMAENRPLATGRWGRRISVGATAVALAGREIAVAQAAPSQAILIQDEQVYAFPDIASWRGDYVAETAVGETLPLGHGEDETPRLFLSQAAPGDVIALCSTSVGRALARDEDGIVALYGGRLLTGDLEGSVDRCERLLAEHDIEDGFAVVATVTRLPGRPRFRAAVTRDRRASRDADDTPAAAQLEQTGDLMPPLVVAGGERPAADERAPLFEGVRDWAVDLAELLSASRRRPAPVHDSRQRALAAPGALSVRRYRDSPGLPAEWRANLPRGPGIHLPARLLAVSLILFLALGGTGIATVRQREREARAATSLLQADAALQHAVESPGTAMSAVAEAESAVAAAREAGAAGEAVVRREQELARVRDHTWNIRRLADLTRLGALPAEAAGPVRLALSGRTLYIAAGSLYELDPDEGRLVTLLARGDAVDGGMAGDLRHISIDGRDLVASDGVATYRRDKAGRWNVSPLAVSDVGGLRSDAPVITWGDASYSLSWDGDLVRFDDSSGSPQATVWADVDEAPDLELARDLAIDGRIHVLLDDGRTLTYSRGALAGTASPFIVPALSDPAFLAEAPFATVFYIVDHAGQIGQNVGRIVRLDAEGEAWQYLTPEPVAADPVGAMAARSLASAADVAIDEMTGTVYWVANGEIWRARLPLA